MSILDRIFKALEEQNKSKADLAKNIGAAASTVFHWDKHRDTGFSTEYLLPICEYLGLDIVYVITGEENWMKEPVSAEQDAPALSEDESELLKIFRDLDRQGKVLVLAEAYKQRMSVREKAASGE